jgi:hypothetical protein
LRFSANVKFPGTRSEYAAVGAKAVAAGELTASRADDLPATAATAGIAAMLPFSNVRRVNQWGSCAVVKNLLAVGAVRGSVVCPKGGVCEADYRLL